MLSSSFSNTMLVLNHMAPFTGYPYQGQIIACPVCGAPDHAEVSGIDRRLKRLPTMACRGCGLFFTNPMPTSDELELYYRRFYRLDYQWAVTRPSARHVRKRRHEARTRVAEAQGFLKPGATTLDFGTGSGEMVEAMLDAGFDAYGFEPGGNYSTFAHGRLGGRISAGRWQDQNHDGIFDMVTSFHVFEHLPDPTAAFRALAGWLKADGMAYIEVPDTLALLERKGFASLHFAHVLGFNRHNLELAAAHAGLKLVEAIRPTSLVFRRDATTIDTVALASAGAALSELALAAHPAGAAFMRYHLRKLGLARP